LSQACGRQVHYPLCTLCLLRVLCDTQTWQAKAIHGSQHFLNYKEAPAEPGFLFGFLFY
jgi:hypothetical protein